MREYARISPRFWMGETGKAIREKGFEAQILALYLLTSPHSNMIGLYWCPVSYMAHETGLSIEGATKGLASLYELSFCAYDDASEIVFIYEMAKYQIGDHLNEKDKQAKGVQNAYEELPKNPFLPMFFDSYSLAFKMTNRRGYEGAYMPLASKATAQAQETAQAKEKAAPRKRVEPLIQKPDFVSDRVWDDWLKLRKDKRAPVTETVLEGAILESQKAGMSFEEFLKIWCRRGSQGLEASWLNHGEKSVGRNRQTELEARNRQAVEEAMRMSQ